MLKSVFQQKKSAKQNFSLRFGNRNIVLQVSESRKSTKSCNPVNELTNIL